MRKAGTVKRLVPHHTPAVLSFGIMCQIGQIVFLREFLMVFHGSELSFGVILASWMIWVGIGGRAGSFCGRRTKKPLVMLVATTVAVSALLPASLVLIRSLRGFFPVPPGAYLSIRAMALSSFIATAPAGLIMGSQFVLLSRIWRERDNAFSAIGAEKTYIGEAAGTVLGGLLFTFVFVRYLNSFQMVAAASLLMAASLFWLLSDKRRVLLVLFLPLAAFFPFSGLLDAFTHGLQWRFFSPEHTLKETRQSKYGAVFTAQRDDQYSFYQSGNLVFSTAGAETERYGFEEQEGVVFAHFAMVQHANPKKVLLVGGGLRGTLREMLLYPLDNIDYLELDPVLFQAALRYAAPETSGALRDPRVRLVHEDGRLFLKKTNKTYDMIIIDVPDPATAALNRYYTKEFFLLVKQRLNPGGVFVMGAETTADLRGAALVNRNAAIYHTLKAVFPHVLPAGERFLFFFASEETGRISSDAALLQERYRDLGVFSREFSPGFFSLLLEESNLRRINWIIRNHGRTPKAHLLPPETGPLFPVSLAEQAVLEYSLEPVNEKYFLNSDFKPIAYYYTIQHWRLLAGGDGNDVLSRIIRVKPWWLAPPAGAALAAAFVLRAGGKKKNGRAGMRFAVANAVFTTGFSTMAMQIAVLFAFQSLYGYVYEMIGLITAVFMAGLGCGTFAVHKLVPEKSSLRLLALFQGTIALFAGLIAFILPIAGGIQSPAGVFVCISVITFIAGILNGLDFPVTAACVFSLARDPEKSAGAVYSLELFGACAGALLASVVIAPVMGIRAVCLAAAIVNGVALLVLIVSRRPHEKERQFKFG